MDGNSKKWGVIQYDQNYYKQVIKFSCNKKFLGGFENLYIFVKGELISFLFIFY